MAADTKQRMVESAAQLLRTREVSATSFTGRRTVSVK